MPLYPYICPTCSTTRDVKRSIAFRDEPVICPNADCNGTWHHWVMERAQAAPAFVIKGYAASNGYS